MLGDGKINFVVVEEKASNLQKHEQGNIGEISSEVIEMKEVRSLFARCKSRLDVDIKEAIGLY